MKGMKAMKAIILAVSTVLSLDVSNSFTLNVNNHAIRNTLTTMKTWRAPESRPLEFEKDKRCNIIKMMNRVRGLISSSNKLVHKAGVMLLLSAVLASRPCIASMSSPATLMNQPINTQLVSTSTNSYDKILMNYVEKHMFDENVYDSMESTYREAFNDKLTNQNNVLSYINSNTLFKPQQFNPIRLITTAPNAIINAVVNIAAKNGMDPKLVRIFMAVFIVAVTPVSLLYFLLSAGGIFRKVLMKRETKRYGAISDLSAEEKEEDIEEADEDDDDDDDYDEDDNGNDDE